MRLKLQEWVRLFLGIPQLRDSEERHYRDLLRNNAELVAALARIEAQQAIQHAETARFIALLEPVAKHAQMPPPRPVLDWNEVERENLQEFEENAHGIRS